MSARILATATEISRGFPQSLQTDRRDNTSVRPRSFPYEYFASELVGEGGPESFTFLCCGVLCREICAMGPPPPSGQTVCLHPFLVPGTRMMHEEYS
jgi:hypothetical protein